MYWICWKGMRLTSWIEHSRLVFLLGTGWQIWSFITLEGSFSGVSVWRMSDQDNVSSQKYLWLTNSLWGLQSQLVKVVGAPGQQSQPLCLPQRALCCWKWPQAQDKVRFFPNPSDNGDNLIFRLVFYHYSNQKEIASEHSHNVWHLQCCRLRYMK